MSESNYLTYDHAFTEAAALAVQRDAERKCAERKLVASRADSVCTMERCTTHFYCVEKD